MTRLLAFLACSLILAVCPALADPAGPVLEHASYTCVVPPGVPCPPTSREVFVYFDESVDPVTGADPANYHFPPVDDPEAVIPLQEVWGVWENEVGLFFTLTPENVDHLLTVSGVEDLDGNPMEPQSWVVVPLQNPDAVPDLLAPVLLPAAPNPFNPATEVSFVLPGAGAVELAVFDLAGGKVATLVDGTLPAGTHARTWRPKGLASGTYLLRLQAGGMVAEQKVSLLR